MPRVFISYSHDSPEHSERVLKLAWALRQNGSDVELDQFHNEEIVDWPRWCNEQISREHSDFVVCVGTAEYRRRIEGNVPPEKGKGVYWEGSLLDDDMYDDKGNRRIVPILLDNEPEQGIPRFLRGWTYCRMQDFRLDDPGFEHLVRILTQQVKVEKNPVGPVPVLPSRQAPASAQASAGSSRHSDVTHVSVRLTATVLLGILFFTSFALIHFKRPDPELARLKTIVEELQKQLPLPLNSKQIEREVKLRNEEPKQFRGDNVYWPNGATIRIAFLDGDQTLREKIFSIAKEWTKYANLTFLSSSVSDSDIRVSFKEPGEWSFMGTQCLSIPKNEVTTNLGINHDDELESRHLILHAFGHVLGLIHEHQIPSAKLLIDLEKASSFFGGPPYHWDSATVDVNLKPYNDAGRFYLEKPYDPYSVMLHKLPDIVLNAGMATKPGDQLSPGDIALVRSIYPGK